MWTLHGGILHDKVLVDVRVLLPSEIEGKLINYMRGMQNIKNRGWENDERFGRSVFVCLVILTSVGFGSHLVNRGSEFTEFPPFTDPLWAPSF